MVWPKFTEVPLYKLKPSKLDADEAKFHSLCSRLKKMTPICINGLPGTGSLNIWSAKVQEILDEDWGLVEVSSYPRDAKKEFSYKFICFFHKSDGLMTGSLLESTSSTWRSRSQLSLSCCSQ